MKANQKKEKNGMRKKELSILLPEKTLEKIVIEMIQHVIDNEVYNPPYIAWVSKGQLLFGEGRHWKEAPSHLKKGILRHVGVTLPKQGELDRQKRQFGYCMEVPEPRCWALTGLMKSEFINKKAQGKDFNSIEFVWGRGYIDPKTCKLNPEYSYGITGWFILHRDMADHIVDWFTNQPDYIRAQYARVCDTFKDVIQQQIESGNAKAITNSYLLDQETYKKVRDKLQKNKQLPDLSNI